MYVDPMLYAAEELANAIIIKAAHDYREANLERTYQDTLGGTDTYTVTEKMYHHASFPSYETVKEQSKKRG